MIKNDYYTASNGLTITPEPFGFLGLQDYVRGISINKRELTALREYFQHERDVELGRWRDPEAPNLVVPENDYKDGRAVRIIDEATGTYYSLREVKHSECEGMHATAARYFAAHPEPKPWHSAEPGEVWLLDVKDRLERETPATVTEHPEFLTYHGDYYPITSRSIAHATRIWPTEGDSDE